MSPYLGSLSVGDRAALSELLIATNAFSSDEVLVALELFDESFDVEHGSDLSANPPEQREWSARAVVQQVVDYEFLGAFSADDRLTGYACFGPTPAADGTFDLYWLAVHPQVQGNGVGRMLVKQVESQLGARGVRLLVVETSSRADYASTRNFYTRRGYVEAARVRDFYAPADDRIIYTTRLNIRDRGAVTR